jgi:hypothetical protein
LQIELIEFSGRQSDKKNIIRENIIKVSNKYFTVYRSIDSENSAPIEKINETDNKFTRNKLYF